MQINHLKRLTNLQIILLVLYSVFFSCQSNHSGLPVYKQPDFSPEKRVEDLMERMTLEEKVGQLSQRRYLTRKENQLIRDSKKGKMGSVLHGRNVEFGPVTRNRLQKAAVEGTRLGIPVIFGHDVHHGCRTLFPLSLAQSCTWSPELIKKAAHVAAREASAYGIDWTFAPMVDVSRDPRWGRVSECYGEDPYLNSIMGAAAVKGFQGKDVSNPRNLVACMKHFIGYSASVGGRDYQYTPISKRDMHEIHLKPFKAGVQAGALTVMSAFNDINGVPATANALFLQKILKDKWGFKGFVVSDWDAVVQLIDHGYAIDSAKAAMKAISAGVDMEMKSLSYQKLVKMARKGSISEKIIDDAVRRILLVKFKKGLFEHPYTDTSRIHKALLSQGNRNLARKIARQSMVLLQNKNHVLPVGQDINEIAVTGPFARETELMGWWKSKGKAKDVVSPLAGMRQNAKQGLQVKETVSAGTDLIIACVGESYNSFGEYHSRSKITLPAKQEEFLKSLQKFNKPVVTVVFNGRPLDLQKVIQYSDAVIIAWHPGTEAGNALADVLYGDSNPSGKLTMSFPKATGQIPVYYNHRNSGRPDQANYIDLDEEPLFPFGYGLSYTRFRYSDLKLSAEMLSPEDSLIITARITNTGKMGGHEIVQLYVRDEVGSTTRPVKELKAFKKTYLEPGESREIRFSLYPEDLTVLNRDFLAEVEPGDFNLWVAPNSEEGLQSEFTITN